MTEAEAIAKGLTEAQRRAVLSGSYNDDSSLRDRQRPMFYALTDLGLFESTHFKPSNSRGRDFDLSALGLAVRRILEDRESGR